MQQNIINSCLEPLCPKKMAFKCNTNPFHWLRNLNPCVHVTLTSVDWPPHPPPRHSPHLHPRTSGHRWWHQTMSVTALTHCKTSTSSDASASSFSFFHCGVNNNVISYYKLSNFHWNHYTLKSQVISLYINKSQSQFVKYWYM